VGGAGGRGGGCAGRWVGNGGLSQRWRRMEERAEARGLRRGCGCGTKRGGRGRGRDGRGAGRGGPARCRCGRCGGVAVGRRPRNCRRLCGEAGFAAGLVEVVGGLSRSRS